MWDLSKRWAFRSFISKDQSKYSFALTWLFDLYILTPGPYLVLLPVTVLLDLFLHITSAVLNPNVQAPGAWRWPQEIIPAWRKRLDIFILYLLGYIRWNPQDPWCLQKFCQEVKRYYSRSWYTRSPLSHRFRPDQDSWSDLSLFFFFEVGFFFIGSCVYSVYTQLMRSWSYSFTSRFLVQGSKWIWRLIHRRSFDVQLSKEATKTNENQHWFHHIDQYCTVL